jgi:hypothetical protein
MPIGGHLLRRISDNGGTIRLHALTEHARFISPQFEITSAPLDSQGAARIRESRKGELNAERHVLEAPVH